MIVSKLEEENLSSAASLIEGLFPAEGWSGEDLQKSLSEPDRPFFTLMEEGEVIGCAGLQKSGEQGDVLTIGVDPAHRRKGGGKALLEAMIEAFKKEGGKTLFLEVREGNLPARALYERCHFKEIHRRKGYYRDPKEDAVIYQLEVDG